MRDLLLCGLLATTALSAFARAADVSSLQQMSDAEREARAFIRTFQDATTRRDRAQLERLMTPEFTAIDRAGTTRNRATWIEQAVAGAMLAQKSEPEELSDDLAVVGTGAAIRTTVSRFQDVVRQRDICVKTRTVYARFDREWRVISMQQTQLHDGPIVTSGFEGVTGKYLLDAGRAITIAKVGRTLFATLPTGVGNVPLFETPDGRLLGPGGEFVYTFERDPSGRASAVTMTRYGKPVWRAKRAD
jgi:ketosteroid isomerase-like protein